MSRGFSEGEQVDMVISMWAIETGISSSARGAQPQAYHGPLQRLLGAVAAIDSLSPSRDADIVGPMQSAKRRG